MNAPSTDILVPTTPIDDETANLIQAVLSGRVKMPRRSFLALLGMMPMAASALTWQKQSSISGPSLTWQKVSCISGPNLTWQKVNSCGGGGPTPLNLTIAANCKNYNIFTAAGSPATAKAVTVTINSGIVVGSTSTATYAMDTGNGWAAGSTITIVNNGYICGKGGLGGRGGYRLSSSGPIIAPVAGLGGGPALNLQWPTSITNASGYVYSGGGGGGGGARYPGGAGGGWGAGGGGGAGSSAGLPGLHGGLVGGLTVGGAGGPSQYSHFGDFAGYPGGAGGNKGASGVGAGASGGGHALAIQRNSNVITWVSGQARVYGGIS